MEFLHAELLLNLLKDFDSVKEQREDCVALVVA